MTAAIGPLIMCGKAEKGWQKSPDIWWLLVPTQKLTKSTKECLESIYLHLWAVCKQAFVSKEWSQLLKAFTRNRGGRKEQDHFWWQIQTRPFLLCLRLLRKCHSGISGWIIACFKQQNSRNLQKLITNGHYHEQCFILFGQWQSFGSQK